MARRQNTFKEVDVKRAIKVARDLGLDVVTTEITSDGTIRIIHRMGEARPETPDAILEAWKAKHDARPA